MKPTTVASNSIFIEQGLVEIFGQDIQLLQPTSVDFSAVRQSAVQAFGQAVARGMFLRSGRAAFYYWLRENGDSLGWREVKFRLLPAPARIKRVLSDALRWLKDENFLKAELSSTDEAWQIAITGLTGDKAHIECNLFLGMLQEMVCWAGAGKFYSARESECQSVEAEHCLFEISKQPVG
jgi:hypothetical protein